MMKNLSRWLMCAALWLMLTACMPSATPATLPPTSAATTQPQAQSAPTLLPTATAPPTAVPSTTESAAPIATTVPPPAALPDTERTPSGTIVAQPTPAASKSTDKDPMRMAIPSIRVDSPVVYVGWTTVIQGNQLVSEWDTADFAVGFHNTSALPGTIGNTVMSGHNNIKGEVFRNLDQVKVGDKITVNTRGGTTLSYVVTQAMIVSEKFASAEQRAKNAQWIAPTDDNRLTLISCWPYTNNTHRVIVVAKPN